MKFKQFIHEGSNDVLIDKMDRITKLNKNLMDKTAPMSWTMNGGKINLGNKLFISRDMLEDGEFPVPLGIASRIDVRTGDLISFKNFPHKLLAQPTGLTAFYGLMNTNIKTIENFPESISGEVNFDNYVRISLGNIHKTVKELDNLLTVSQHYAGPILGILMVKKLNKLDMSIVGSSTKSCAVDRIMNKHLSGDRDVMDCHEELTRAGLKEYAKL
jgi:hypothetical protein